MRFGNVVALEDYPVYTPFNTTTFLEQIRTYLPNLDSRNQWIRSGNRISNKYKHLISSYKLLGSYRPKTGRTCVEVLLIKPQPLSHISEMKVTALEFIREYQLENRVDVIFAALLSTADETWHCFMTMNNGTVLPFDLISYLVANTLKKHLKKSCGLSDAALDGYFSPCYALYDDTAIKKRAQQIDNALADIEVCDISAGNGDLLAAFLEKIVSVRDDMSKYIGRGPGRTKESFHAHFSESSLYATDLDISALELLKLRFGRIYGRHVPDEHATYGSVLTEDIFNSKKFDIIISNPPHMRQEEFTAVKGSFSNYNVFHKNADLYCYYVERALTMLKENGCACIITSNRWMRSGYGAPLRAFLSEHNVTDLLNYGNIPATKGMAMPISALTIFNCASSDGKINVATVVDRNFDDIAEVAEAESSLFELAGLGEKPWVFEADNQANAVMHKITTTGVPLGKYVNGEIYRGILTGFNEAFVIGTAVATEFIEQDAGSNELLLPFVSGRNVKRYAKLAVKKHLISIPKGFTNKRRGVRDPWDWFSSSYPAIAEHLIRFEEQAKGRRDKGDYWWELRSCKYYEAFERVKIISPTIVKRISATMDAGGVFSNDKTCIIAAGDYYLLGLLNSRLMDFYARRIATGLLNDYYELKPANLSALPIKKISETNSFQTKLRDSIAENAKKLLALTVEEGDGSAEIAETERALNRAVYKLYKLNAKEINIVENN